MIAVICVYMPLTGWIILYLQSRLAVRPFYGPWYGGFADGMLYFYCYGIKAGTGRCNGYTDMAFGDVMIPNAFAQCSGCAWNGWETNAPLTYERNVIGGIQ